MRTGVTSRGALAVRWASLAVLLVVVIGVAAAYELLTPPQQNPYHITSNPTNPSFNGSTINVGFLTELTSATSGVPNAYAAKIGAELAVNQTNAAGGIDGKQVSLIVVNDETKPQLAVQDASTLDRQDQVLAITGPTDLTDALAIGEYAEANHVPLVVSAVSSALLTPPGSSWTVSVEPAAPDLGVAIAKYVSEAVPHAKIALMTQNAEQENEMSEGVRWFASTYKNESLVFDQEFENAQFPWATAATSAKYSGADAVIVSWLPTLGFSQSNVISALLSAGFLQDQIFLASADGQVTDVGLNATGIRGVTLFDSGMATGYPNATAFVNEVSPYIYGQKANPVIAYCGICPTEIGANYYYSYLGMVLMLNAIKAALSTNPELTRADFMSALKHQSTTDVLGNVLSIESSGASSGSYYVVSIGQLNGAGLYSGNGTTYGLKLLKAVRFSTETVPSYSLAKGA